ncbi:3-keto-disaccharide hydrolase [Dyadobacter arcticus]|uniref:3-keto-alpha-glucoside-1,2-lyase/3-keto-2-hydroxy-glucal hydratase domain-containing protein n=1 Tax=Dyadobacter arcticus TaxID=1078754 RepID=A0ABX0UPB8_9BACT|nr:DUF1080 domain-containing protein [Dyadobacter arcticus]NIJ53814.1 hypothetical protein [Dyadobacter arcticus]
MKYPQKIHWIVICLLIASTTAFSFLKKDVTCLPDEWTTLFDGKTVKGWHSYNQTAAVGWMIEDGALTSDGSGGDLVTDKEYGDFDLEFEFKIPKGSNGGILYKVLEQPDIKRTVFSGPEYQIIDDQNYVVKNEKGEQIALKPVQLTGANYDINPPSDPTAFKAAGNWNTGRILVKNNRVMHYLNGRQVADYQYGDETWKAKVAESKYKDWPYATPHHKGKIALQSHNVKEKVWFKNIRIKELD